MKNKRILFIVLLFIILFFGNIFEASGASIDGGTNPGKVFQTASNWVGGNLPGSYTDSNGDGIYDFNVSNNTPLYIDGYVKLTGNLNLIRWGNLYIQDNAVFIIDGDFNLGDCSDVYLGENAILYITGNLNVVNITNQYWYTKIYQDKNSNVVIKKKKNLHPFPVIFLMMIMHPL